jgi:hypothetical protein
VTHVCPDGHYCSHCERRIAEIEYQREFGVPDYYDGGDAA